MKKIEFDIEMITPMFMSGENQAKFELRPPSFKGAMRFWWRAYCWGNNTQYTDLEELQKYMMEKEGEIFGTASDKGRKSGFSIRLKKQETNAILDPFPKHFVKAQSGGRTFNINILEYLAYGTYNYQRGKGNVFNRKYIPAGSVCSVILNISDETVEKDVIRSFYFLSVFGGLGAKSRNGFGNFVIKKIALENRDLLKGLEFPFPTTKFFDEMMKNDKLPGFSGFSKHMKIFKLKQSHDSWADCLAKLGTIYRTSKLQLDEPHKCEKRQYIASPIAVQKHVGGRMRTYDGSFLERRAKPYFLKVIKIKNGFDGYIIYLPSKYCEGLSEDRYDNPIPDDADEKFKNYCDEFNEYLLYNGMEIYYKRL